MKSKPMPESYFQQISEEPLELHPFDPDSKRRALEYRRTLELRLNKFKVPVELHGSTDLELTGKGEWEFALWLEDSNWYAVIVNLVNHFHGIYTLDDEFALFEDTLAGTSIEIIGMRGEVAVRNKTLMAYWRGDASARAEYEQGKLKHAYSKRAYYRWKDSFINQILERL